MRASKFKPQDYLQRFADGIAFYSGLPYRVMIDRNDIHLVCLVSGDIKYRSVQNDELLDVSSPPLGYINTSDGAIYITRIPRRRYKQCIDAQSVEESMLKSDGHKVLDRRLGGSLFTKNFYDSYANEYPKLESALKMLKKRQSVAISRDFALTLDELGIIKVWYKYDQIGWIDPLNTKICKVPDTDKGFLISYYLTNSFGWEVE